MKNPLIKKYYLTFSFEIYEEKINIVPSYIVALKKIDRTLHLHNISLASTY